MCNLNFDEEIKNNFTSLNIDYFPTLSFACDEAINTLCTNISFSGENMKKIMITSCHASEGKSFISMNIMRNMTTLGKTVVLIDADMRCSQVLLDYSIKFSSDEHKQGLAHLLSGMAGINDIVYSTNIDNAYIIPIGRIVSNPLPLLNSSRFTQLLDQLVQNVDYILIDAPPVGSIIDAAQIAKSCDGIVIVVNYNNIRRQELIDTKKQLELTECPIIGTVLNRVEFDNYINKKYYNKSYYSKYDNVKK